KRIFLVLVDINSRTGSHLIEIAIVKLAVVGELAHPVVDIAIGRRVGVTLVDQGVDHADDLGHMPSGTGLVIGTQHTQACLVLMHGGDHALGKRRDAFAILFGTPKYLVVDIGDIAHVDNI